MGRRSDLLRRTDEAQVRFRDTEPYAIAVWHRTSCRTCGEPIEPGTPALVHPLARGYAHVSCSFWKAGEHR